MPPYRLTLPLADGTVILVPMPCRIGARHHSPTVPVRGRGGDRTPTQSGGCAASGSADRSARTTTPPSVRPPWLSCHRCFNGRAQDLLLPHLFSPATGRGPPSVPPWVHKRSPSAEWTPSLPPSLLPSRPPPAGVTRDASPSEVKSGYRRLALQHHPDREAAGTEDVRWAAEPRRRLCPPGVRSPKHPRFMLHRMHQFFYDCRVGRG